jgi:hypothetical protein
MSCNYALVGGNSGIGLALARRLVAAGHTVHAAARTAGPLAELGVHVQPFDAESPGALVWPERLDGFVYCPGTITLKSFGRLTADDFLRDLRVNLLGAVAAPTKGGIFRSGCLCRGRLCRWSSHWSCRWSVCRSVRRRCRHGRLFLTIHGETGLFFSPG